MSRSDYIFFNTLGQRYKETAEEFEGQKHFDSAQQNYVVAGECFGRAEEIAKQDMMTEHGVSGQKKAICQEKAKLMQEKSREAMSSVKFHHSHK